MRTPPPSVATPVRPRWIAPDLILTVGLLLGACGDGDASHACHGSWDTTSAWGVAGGRVYTTAINALTLRTTRRYESLGRR